MTALFSFLFVLTISKELLYFNEELLVIVSFISFLSVVSVSVGGLVGASLDASIREVTDGVSSKISDYTGALDLNREILLSQLAVTSGCSSTALTSLGSVFGSSEVVSLKTSTVTRLLNVVLARSFIENSTASSQQLEPSSLHLPVIGSAQSGILSNSFSPVEDTCLAVLPSDAFILAVVNSLLFSSLR